MFEYQLEADFAAEKDSEEVSGSFKITEINESDFDFHIPSISISKESNFGDQVKIILKKNLKQEIINAIQNL